MEKNENLKHGLKKDRYSKIYEKTPSFILVIDKNGKIVDINKPLLNCLGYPKKEIVGKNNIEFVPKKYRQAIIDEIEYTFNSKESETTGFECEVIAKDSSKRNIYFSKGHGFLEGKDGSTYLVISGIDLTEIKTAKKEKRIKKFEDNNKANLTKNEKTVLWGITKYPYNKDKELAEILNMPRPTITSIKNRLEEKKIYSTAIMPNFKALGAKLITLVYGKHDNKHKDILPKSDYSLSSKNYFIRYIVSKDFLEFKKNLDLNYNLISKCSTAHFLFRLNKFYKFFEYSDILKKHFNININEKKIKTKEVKRKLTKNEKKVLLAMIENPCMSTSNLGFEVDLTRATVAKIKKRLINEGIIRKKIIPNTSFIGLNLMFFIHIINNSEQKLIDTLKKSSSFASLIIGKNELTGIGFLRNKKEYFELKEILSKNKESARIKISKIPVKDIVSQNFNLIDATKKLV